MPLGLVRIPRGTRTCCLVGPMGVEFTDFQLVFFVEFEVDVEP